MECDDCGREYTPVYKNKNAKYCRVCQIYGRLKFFQGKTKECWGCDKEFVPLSSRQVVCGACDPVKSKHSTEGVCGICAEDRKDLLGTDVQVCSACASDPELQRVLMKALLKKRNA